MQLATSRRSPEDRRAGAQRIVDAANDGDARSARLVRCVSNGESEPREIRRGVRAHPFFAGDDAPPFPDSGARFA
jgi:hypothetical protein